MIQSLEDAERWLKATRNIARFIERISKNYWNSESKLQTLGETLYRDKVFGQMEANEIGELARQVLADLDDLAVLLMFSVFEATVRQRMRDGMDREMAELPQHLVLRRAVEEAREVVAHGSFGNLTNSYKGLDADQKSLVDQVRIYRNWVAHGRRDKPVNNITPEAAHDRLRTFLGLLEAHLEQIGDTISPP